METEKDGVTVSQRKHKEDIGAGLGERQYAIGLVN